MTKKKGWMDKLSETVDKATAAATEAWENTSDTRKDAWDKTKEAASSASGVLDEGVAEVKQAYNRGESPTPTDIPTFDEPAFDYGKGPRLVSAPTGSTLHSKGWLQEAVLRCLLNNLDPEVAEIPLDLVVYGGRGKASQELGVVRRDRQVTH